MTFLELGKDSIWKTLLLLKYLILLRTDAFVAKSEEGSPKDNLFYSLTIFASLVATVTFTDVTTIPTNLIFSDPTMPEPFTGGLMLNLIPIISTSIFAFVAARKLSWFAIFNLNFMMSLLAFILMSLLSFVPMTSSTMNADYELMKVGQGGTTEAYGQTCGNLERKAEQLFLHKRMLSTISGGTPSSTTLSPRANDVTPMRGEIDTERDFGFYRSQFAKDYIRIVALENQIINSRTKARTKYLSAFYAFGIGLILCSLFAVIYWTIHCYRFVFISTMHIRSKRFRHIYSSASVSAIFVIGSLIYWISNANEGVTVENLLDDAGSRNRYLELRREGLAAEINLLRVKFVKYAVICPGIDRHGLW